MREEIVRSAFSLESQELERNYWLRPREWSSIDLEAARAGAPDAKPYIDDLPSAPSRRIREEDSKADGTR